MSRARIHCSCACLAVRPLHNKCAPSRTSCTLPGGNFEALLHTSGSLSFSCFIHPLNNTLHSCSQADASARAPQSEGVDMSKSGANLLLRGRPASQEPENPLSAALIRQQQASAHLEHSELEAQGRLEDEVRAAIVDTLMLDVCSLLQSGGLRLHIWSTASSRRGGGWRMR